MAKDIKIIVATHKKCAMPQDKMYLPLHVGAEGKKNANGTPLDFGYQKDNTGENISSLNWCFGTQTGLYWLWKNLKADYSGLVHYRRYFLSHAPKHGEKPSDCILTYDELFHLLNMYKVIVPKKRHYYVETIYSHYAHTMARGGEQFDIARKVISEISPDYLSSFDNFMKQRSGYIFNMMIMEKSRLDSYCKWLFPILFEIYQRFDTTGMNDFDKRYIGRVSERLFNVWLKHQVEHGQLNKNDIKEMPYTEDVNMPRKIVSFVNAKIFHRNYGSSF